MCFRTLTRFPVLKLERDMCVAVHSLYSFKIAVVSRGNFEMFNQISCTWVIIFVFVNIWMLHLCNEEVYVTQWIEAKAVYQNSSLKEL